MPWGELLKAAPWLAAPGACILLGIEIAKFAPHASDGFVEGVRLLGTFLVVAGGAFTFLVALVATIRFFRTSR
jgi:hypothetical protein